MQGSYDPVLVLVSYLVAVIAAYIALYFGTRLFHVQDGPTRKLWLAIGSACLGMGIWSMHFVGMAAYHMPMGMTMSFHLGLTTLSIVPALLASLLALTMIMRTRVSVPAVMLSALVMGAGIAAMHYTGMAAMRMTPPITYDPLLFWLSIAIAVGASGAALVIGRQIRQANRHVTAIRVVAALVMGVAICGMHYTGMAAAMYSPDAAMPVDNLLRGFWVGIPVGIGTVVFLVLALLVARQDFRHSEHMNRWRNERDDWTRTAAQKDHVTGLLNREAFQQSLRGRLQFNLSDDAFHLVHLHLTEYHALLNAHGAVAANRLIRDARHAFSTCLAADSVIARFADNQLVAIVADLHPDSLQRIAKSLREDLRKSPRALEFGAWTCGFAEALPGSEAESLLQEASQVQFKADYAAA